MGRTAESKSVTNDQIRIAVAELCGWKKISCDCEGQLWGFFPGNSYESEVPNYPESLDACAEFEKAITTETDMGYYTENLAPKTGYAFPQTDSDLFKFATATPLQRCEAFLRLHGRWIEKKEKP